MRSLGATPSGVAVADLAGQSRVDGPTELTTVSGVLALIPLSAGIALLLLALLQPVRPRRRIAVAAVLGAGLGLGANLLFHRLGFTRLTAWSVALWLVLPAAASAGAAWLERRGRRPEPSATPPSTLPPTQYQPPPWGHLPHQELPPDRLPRRRYARRRRRPPDGELRPLPTPPPQQLPPDPRPGGGRPPTPLPPADEVGTGPPPEGPAPEPRYLQARLFDLTSPARPVTRAIAPDVPHALDVAVAPPRLGWLVAPGVFPDHELPPDRTNRLTVVVSEPAVLGAPVVGTIDLPPFGESTTFRWEFTASRNVSRMLARVTVLHGNRVLQTALLRAPVTDRPGPADRVEFGLEAVLRTDLDDLGFRQEYGASLLLNHHVDGTPTVTKIVQGRAELTRLDGIDKLVDDLSGRLTAVTADPDVDQSLTAPQVLDLLRYLAAQGAELRRRLIAGQGVDEQLATQEYLQVLTLHPESYLPIEFLYDLPPPTRDATLCPNAAAALEQGRCPGDCPHRTERPCPVICPLAFWGLSRVIERHAVRPGARPPADIVLTAGPSRERNRLRATSGALFAYSDRVNRRPKTADQVLAALTEITAGRAAETRTWADWVSRVGTATPTLLVLLPHTLEDEQFGQPALEIGAGEQLPVGYLDRGYVGAAEPPPIVLLLGCDTAKAPIEFEGFVTGFQASGAAIVLGTVATVLGYQAAPVAAAMVRELASGHDGATFGEMLRATRRRLLRDGLAMSLALTAYGDADWRLA